MSNSKILNSIKLFCDEYLKANPESVYKYSKSSLYIDIINIYYNMGVRENEIKRFEPVFFKEYFESKETTLGIPENTLEEEISLNDR